MIFDPSDLRIEPDSAFADRLQRELVARLESATAAPQIVRPMATPPIPEVPLVSNDPVRRRPILWIAAAALVGAAVVGVAISAQQPDDDPVVVDETPTTESGASTTTAPTTTLAVTTTVVTTTAGPTTTTAVEAVSRSIDELPSITPIAELRIEQIAELDRPMQLATDGTTVWVAQDTGPVVGFDAASGEQVMVLDVVNGEHALRPIVAFGSVWVLTEVDNQLRRFDPQTGAVTASLDLPGLVGGQDPHLAATDDAIYVLIQEDGPSLATIDPDTVTMTNRVPLSGTTYHIAADGERVYGLSLGTASVIDPSTGKALEQRIAAQSMAVTFAFDSFWALTGTGGQELLRFDAETLEPVADVAVTPAGLTYVSAAATDDALWVLTQAAFMRIDPTDSRVVARYGPPTGGGALVATETALWFTDWNNGTVGRIPLPVAEG